MKSKRWRTQNLMVEIVQKTYEATQNLMVEVAYFETHLKPKHCMLKIWWLKLHLKNAKLNWSNIEVLKIWWLKITKTLKNEKSDGWSITKTLKNDKIWLLKSHKTLNYAKSDGWRCLKHWSAQTVMVEVA